MLHVRFSPLWPRACQALAACLQHQSKVERGLGLGDDSCAACLCVGGVTDKDWIDLLSGIIEVTEVLEADLLPLSLGYASLSSCPPLYAYAHPG